MASLSLSFSSSIVPSPKSNPNPINQDPIFRFTRCSTSAPASKTASVSSSYSSSLVSKNRHRKEGECPCILVTSFSERARNTPINKKKMKNAENKNNAKALVHTLPETFSYCIHKKQWLKALEVSHHAWVVCASKIHHFFFFFF